jgi:REP element-mobilizing transposase RayT
MKIQSVTYRLADALPADVLAKIEEQALGDAKRRAAIERHLDAGHGSCVLRVPDNAEAVIAAWRHGDGRQYRLHAWVVMPNHVHVLVESLAGNEIGEIIGAWKSISARKILSGSATAPGRKGPHEATEGGRAPRKRHLWQLDYWDRFIRNQQHHEATVDYIHQNPVKAGLVTRAEDWPWISALRGSATAPGRNT